MRYLIRYWDEQLTWQFIMISRSLTFHKGKGFLYKQQDSDNCLVIQSNASGEQTFLPQDGSRIFKGSIQRIIVRFLCQIKGVWGPVQPHSAQISVF